MKSQITDEMIRSAIKQAQKDSIIPVDARGDQYAHYYDSFERIIEKALEKDRRIGGGA